MVPLTTELLTIDYIVQEKYPLIFVTSGKLGSINHTLLSLEAIQKRGIVLDTVLYNLYPTVEDKTIQNDTMEFIRTWLKKYFPETKFILVPEIKNNHRLLSLDNNRTLLWIMAIISNFHRIHIAIIPFFKQ